MCPHQIPSGVADSLGGNLVFPAALECHSVTPTVPLTPVLYMLPTTTILALFPFLL